MLQFLFVTSRLLSADCYQQKISATQKRSRRLNRRSILKVKLPGKKYTRGLRTRLFKNHASMKSGAVRRLHWGCGSKATAGWINADILKGRGIDISCDIHDGLPLENNSVDYAVGIHALSEIAYSNIVPVLKELHRVLKPGGVLRLALPDMEKALAAYQSGNREYFLIPDKEVASPGGKLIVHLLWYGGNRTLFTADFMEEMMLKAGFQSAQRCAFQQTNCRFGSRIVELDDRPHESLFVEAVK